MAQGSFNSAVARGTLSSVDILPPKQGNFGLRRQGGEEEVEVVGEAVVKEAEGLQLYLSSRGSTGYQGVTYTPQQHLKPYMCTGRNHVYLGNFVTAVEAAVCFARSERSQQEVVGGAVEAAEGSEATAPAMAPSPDSSSQCFDGLELQIRNLAVPQVNNPGTKDRECIVSPKRDIQIKVVLVDASSEIAVDVNINLHASLLTEDGVGLVLPNSAGQVLTGEIDVVTISGQGLFNFRMGNSVLSYKGNGQPSQRFRVKVTPNPLSTPDSSLAPAPGLGLSPGPKPKPNPNPNPDP